MITVTKQVVFTRSARGRKRLADKPALEPLLPLGRVPRVSRVMALAIQFDRLLREGVVRNTTELARLAHVTQPRITQVMQLLHLAPDIQEELLFLPPVTQGRDPITERDVRSIAAILDWRKQRAMWRELRSAESGDASEVSLADHAARGSTLGPPAKDRQKRNWKWERVDQVSGYNQGTASSSIRIPMTRVARISLER
ncbi:hypothetical protein JCM19992_35360 [Thermostilla marina]